MFKKNNKGFTLIEMLIVIAIMGIIYAISFPSYQSFIQKSRRADARETLLSLALSQENFFTQHQAYTTDISSAAGLNKGTATSSQGFYNITVSAGETGSINSSFKLIAIVTGVQVSDESCNKFTLDSNTNSKAFTKTNTDNNNCW